MQSAHNFLTKANFAKIHWNLSQLTFQRKRLQLSHDDKRYAIPTANQKMVQPEDMLNKFETKMPKLPRKHQPFPFHKTSSQNLPYHLPYIGPFESLQSVEASPWKQDQLA